MQEQFVTYEIALALKELGFNEPCLAWYLPEIFEKGNICTPILGSYFRNWNMFSDRLNAPLLQQAVPFLNRLLLNLGYEKSSKHYILTDFSDLHRLELELLNIINICKK